MNKFLLLAAFCLIIVSCSTKKATLQPPLHGFQFFKLTDTIEITVTSFVKNTTYCYTEALPYALIIGNVKSNDKYPATISILALCDNNVYKIGENIKIGPAKNWMSESSLKPLYFVRDTVINKVKYRYLIGSEYPAAWGSIMR